KTPKNTLNWVYIPAEKMAKTRSSIKIPGECVPRRHEDTKKTFVPPCLCGKKQKRPHQNGKALLYLYPCGTQFLLRYEATPSLVACMASFPSSQLAGQTSPYFSTCLKASTKRIISSMFLPNGRSFTVSCLTTPSLSIKKVAL